MGDQAELICPGMAGGNGCAGVETDFALGPGGLGGGRAIGENWEISQGNVGGLLGCAMVGWNTVRDDPSPMRSWSAFNIGNVDGGTGLPGAAAKGSTSVDSGLG